ncbi:unnamed protein product [Candida verbasci]|uniref:Pre-mRNA-splicing factor SLU7 domain-containing protein n=1 Tax=Candida verbasci TaxID=1227364 RepID=A0A9W4TX09_9ASCO|nr:unnamed protein product [Candida verbasci]
MSKESSTTNPYIPRYILDKPKWYDQNDKEGEDENKDELAHHRNQSEIKDYSLATTGQGINDELSLRQDTTNYDEKRDKYYGYSNEQWLEHLKKWKPIDITTNDNDSDDTDYELELIELGIDKSKLKRNYKQDPMERMIRDRSDIPDYIRNIKMNNEKLEIENKNESDLVKQNLINDESQFVRQSNDDDESKKLQNLQKFAWELDKKAVKHELLPETDLNLSVEASPTLVMLKQKKQEEERQIERENEAKRRKKLLEKYV